MSIDLKNVSESNENLKINIDWLLNDLSQDIARDFWLKEKTIKELIEFKKDLSLDDLKSEISKSESIDDYEKEKISNIDIEKMDKLVHTIKWAKEIIEKASNNELNVLKWELESWNIENFKNTFEEYLDPKLVKDAKEWGSFHKNLLWLALWSWNTIYTTVESLYKIWKWIIKAPLDLYLILSWKWEYTRSI